MNRTPPRERPPTDEYRRMVDEEHLLLDTTEKIKADLDEMVERSNSPLTKGEAYHALADGLGDIESTMLGSADLNTVPYRNARPAIRDWDIEVALRHAQVTARLSHVQRVRSEGKTGGQSR